MLQNGGYVFLARTKSRSALVTRTRRPMRALSGSGFNIKSQFSYCLSKGIGYGELKRRNYYRQLEEIDQSCCAAAESPLIPGIIAGRLMFLAPIPTQGVSTSASQRPREGVTHYPVAWQMIYALDGRARYAFFAPTSRTTPLRGGGGWRACRAPGAPPTGPQ